MDRSGSELGAMTWTEVAGLAAPPILLVPIGSTEQHGPHLPIATDTIIAETLCRRAAERIDTALVTPALTITASGEHQGFSGTLSIGTAALTTMLVELLRSAEWAAGLVLVNGHGGNHGAVTDAVTTALAEGRRVHPWWPRVAGGEPHAGSVETSMLLAIEPALVRVEQAVAGPQPSIGALRRDGVAAHSPSGVLGDPTTATEHAGRAILERLVDDLVTTVLGVAPRWRAAAGR